MSADNVRGREEHVGSQEAIFTYLQEGRCACYHCRCVGYLKGTRVGREEGLLASCPNFLSLASSPWTLLKDKNLSLNTSTLSPDLSLRLEITFSFSVNLFI